MRIAMFADSYKPQINGMATSIEAFTNQFRKKGHRVFIFAPEVPDYKDKEKDIYRVKSVVFSSYKEYRIGLPFRLLVSFPIEKLKPDIIHVHSPFSMGVAGLALAKHYKIPSIGSFHTLFPEYVHYFIKYEKLQRSDLVKKIFRRGAWKYLAWFYNKCDYVIAPTEKIKNALKRHGIEKDIFVIPTGVRIGKTGKSKISLRKKYSFGKDDKIILHVGRITKEKNIDFIISSLKGLLKNNNCRLLIASDGPYREKLAEKVNKLGLEKNVIFTGYLPAEKLRDFYRLSDVFVMASKTETQGIVLLEAAVNGLPVVALDSQVVGNMVRGANIGVVSKSKDFAENVETIFNNKIKPGISKKISKNLAENYSMEKCVRDLIGVYSFSLSKKVSV